MSRIRNFFHRYAGGSGAYTGTITIPPPPPPPPPPTGSGTFTPASLANLTLWLDASDDSTIFLGSGTNVSQWNDKSTSGANVSESSSGTQPAYVATGLGGLPAILFAGYKHLTGLSNFMDAATAGTVIYVYATDNSAGDYSAAPIQNFCSDNGAGGSDFLPWADETYQITFGSTTQNRWSGYVTDDPSPHVWATTSAAGAWQFYKDNTSLFSTTTNTVDFSQMGTGEGFIVGNANNGGVNSGYLSEVILYSRQLTSDELTQVYTYLQAKWGTP